MKWRTETVIFPKSSADRHSTEFDFKSSIKRVMPPSVLFFIYNVVLFVILPAMQIDSYAEHVQGKISVEKLRTSLGCGLFVYLDDTLISIIMWLITIGLGMLCAFFIFFPIMRKNSVNFYFSGTVNRKTYFKNRVLATGISVIVATAIPVLIDIFMNIYFFGHATYMLYNGFWLFCEHIMLFSIGFSFMTVSMMLCYTIIESMVFSVSLMSFPSVIVWVINIIATVFLNGYESSSISVSTSIFNQTTIINPIFAPCALGNTNLNDSFYNYCFRYAKPNQNISAYDSTLYGYENITKEYIIPIVVWLAVSAVMLCISSVLLKNRKLENTAIHASSRFATAFTGVEISILFASSISLFNLIGLNKNDDYLGLIVALVISILISLVAYYIAVSIARRSLKNGIKKLIPGIVSGACVGIGVIICYTGGFGYSTYVPDYDDIQYVTIGTTYTDSSGAMSTSDYYNADYLTDYVYDSSTFCYLGNFQETSSIEKIAEVQQKLAKRTDNLNKTQATIIYKLKNNKSVTRYYQYSDMSVQTDIISLTDTDEYKEQLEYLLSSTAVDEENKMFKNQSSDEYAYRYSSFSDVVALKTFYQKADTYVISSTLAGTQIENTAQLKDAILADLENIGYKDLMLSGDNAIGAISFTNTVDDGAYLETEYGTLNFFVFEKMENTINYLKSVGAYDYLFKSVSDSDVESLTLVNVSNVVNYMISRNYIDETSYTLMMFEAQKLNGGSDSNYTQDEIEDSVELFENGTVITDENSISAIMPNTSLMDIYDGDGYLVLIKYEDGTYVEKYISTANLAEVYE